MRIYRLRCGDYTPVDIFPVSCAEGHNAACTHELEEVCAILDVVSCCVICGSYAVDDVVLWSCFHKLWSIVRVRVAACGAHGEAADHKARTDKFALVDGIADRNIVEIVGAAVTESCKAGIKVCLGIL